MRVVSMVPSWTETLIECGVNVVGRTRFCIHPKDKVQNIAIVGGTKDINTQKVLELTPDLLVLDREENPKSMSELSLPFHATHIEKIEDVAAELSQLATTLNQPMLAETAARWQQVIANRSTTTFTDADSTKNLPILEWLTEKPNVKDKPFRKVYYVIWYNPWMIVSAYTFTGSMLSHLGIKNLPKLETKYPQVTWAELNQPENLILFSSEPYPFLRQKKVIPTLNASAAIVDGEKLSWFGIRSLKYLEEIFQRDT